MRFAAFRCSRNRCCFLETSSVLGDVTAAAREGSQMQLGRKLFFRWFREPSLAPGVFLGSFWEVLSPSAIHLHPSAFSPLSPLPIHFQPQTLDPHSAPRPLPINATRRLTHSILRSTALSPLASNCLGHLKSRLLESFRKRKLGRSFFQAKAFSHGKTMFCQEPYHLRGRDEYPSARTETASRLLPTSVENVERQLMRRYDSRRHP